jgi:hypothetical protein
MWFDIVGNDSCCQGVDRGLRTWDEDNGVRNWDEDEDNDIRTWDKDDSVEKAGVDDWRLS